MPRAATPEGSRACQASPRDRNLLSFAPLDLKARPLDPPGISFHLATQIADADVHVKDTLFVGLEQPRIVDLDLHDSVRAGYPVQRNRFRAGQSIDDDFACRSVDL